MENLGREKLKKKLEINKDLAALFMQKGKIAKKFDEFLEKSRGHKERIKMRKECELKLGNEIENLLHQQEILFEALQELYYCILIIEEIIVSPFRILSEK